ncbi:uncharacterized protein F5147DRAFT_654942 [Suillus discolor]|uniref:Uncharacterized protein n=1 Tax=Suillus discolor TaxID=1912936 RepID=A0A9P7F3I7_9AGAM|nr:uncharacterized protein F5147DRAFT_654942 [Suillus discolor]KAG2102867.1 hypothetical protein F5147DRAFT_654942 [Suillus discolor]
MSDWLQYYIMESTNAQINNNDSLVPTFQPDVPGPLIVSGSAVGVWNTAVETAQYRIQNHTTALPSPFPITIEDKCWVMLMALRREEELQETMRYLENAWRELTKVKKLLGIGS